MTSTKNTYYRHRLTGSVFKLIGETTSNVWKDSPKQFAGWMLCIKQHGLLEQGKSYFLSVDEKDFEELSPLVGMVYEGFPDLEESTPG